jgi:antitoxin ParD1/3/4
MPTRNVVLTDRQSALLDRLVAEGRYQNASEAMRAGLRLIEEREEARHALIVYADELLNYVSALDDAELVPMDEAFRKVSVQAAGGRTGDA